MTHYVPCDACGGDKVGCWKCSYSRFIAVPDVRPNPAKSLRLLTRVFVFLIWFAAIFLVSWEVFGWLANR